MSIENKKILFPILDSDVLYICKQFNQEWSRRKLLKSREPSLCSVPLPGIINIKHDDNTYDPIIFEDSSDMPPESETVKKLNQEINQLRWTVEQRNIRIKDLITEVDRCNGKIKHITEELEFFVNYLKKLNKLV